MTLQVCIMTPDRIFWNEQAEEIILPTNTGQMGVLASHAPLITALDIGVMLIRSKNEWISVALMGGFALLKQNQVTVLVNEAESAKTIKSQNLKKPKDKNRKLKQILLLKEHEHVIKLLNKLKIRFYFYLNFTNF